MARIARITVPGVPHHVTQRGNRRQPIFVEPEDYALYRDLLAERCKANGVDCWAYCLMPNHVHLILAPATAEGLPRAVGEAHRRYAAFFNARARVTGHLFQGRFASVAMDEDHLLAALRYLAFNPVQAGLAASPRDWLQSSVRAHLAGRDDALVSVAPVLARVGRFADLLELTLEEQMLLEGFETKSANGRPMGTPDFIAAVERALGRRVTPGKRGRKPKTPEPPAKAREAAKAKGVKGPGTANAPAKAKGPVKPPAKGPAKTKSLAKTKPAAKPATRTLAKGPATAKKRASGSRPDQSASRGKTRPRG